MSLFLDDANAKAIKERQEQKLKLELTYLRDNVLNALSYLDLVNDERTQELYCQLDSVLVNMRKVIDEGFND